MLIATAGNGSSADSAPSPSLPGPASAALSLGHRVHVPGTLHSTGGATR